MVQQIVDASHSTQIADSSGQTAAVPANNAIIEMTHIVWFSQRQIFHPWFGPEILLLPGYVHAGNLGSAGGFGDMIVSPLVLQWREWKFGPVRMQQRLDFDFFLPTGQYQRTSTVNLSSHAFEDSKPILITP